ncbi:MAG TPA: TRIC cation channel family protein [Polyangiaceae bacterium]|nr:TRIC cation channel family protein [Polyangiaceae bacterium]
MPPFLHPARDDLWSAAGVAFRYFDLCATFLWASTGGLLAARRGYDLTGIFAVALVSSCGGGLLRDSLFLQAGPPALVRVPSYVLLTLLAALLTWLLGDRLLGAFPRAVARASELADGLGLGAFAVVGMRLALAASIGVAGSMLVGVVNSVGGGVLRSMLLRRTPEVFKPGKFTALAAFVGTLAYGALVVAAGVDERAASAVAITLVATLHWVSVRYGLTTHRAWTRRATRLRQRAGQPAPAATRRLAAAPRSAKKSCEPG